MQIAMVDDDADYRDYVCGLVGRTASRCSAFVNGASIMAELRRETFDLLLLDWNLPDISGIELLKSLRSEEQQSMGVIMLTSRADKQDIAAALDAGADDYIVKPEAPEIIMARITAVLRRSQPAQHERFLTVENYEFDRLTRTVMLHGEPIALSSKEFALALLLFQNAHRALSRNFLLESVWRSVPDLSTRTLDMHISKIRTKLKLHPENGCRIVALASYGYRMECFAEQPAA